MEKQKELISRYYKSTEYNTFIKTQLRNKDSERMIDRILYQLTQENILKTFIYIYNKIDNSTFSEVSITMKELVDEMNIRNQTITIILNILIEIDIIKRKKTKDMKHSHKYNIVKNPKELNITDNTLLPITFNENIQELFNKKSTRLRVAKTRNKHDEKILLSIKHKQSKLKQDKQIVKNTIKYKGIYKNDFKEKDQNSGRIGHALINMNKEYRDYILINGNKTISIDFSNFQPLLLSELLINNDDYKDYDDVILFNKLCREGNFYDYVAKTNMTDRTEAKTLWMKVAYGKEYMRVFGDESEVIVSVGRILYKIFPNVVTFMDNLKLGQSKEYMSNFLCELESNIINPISEELHNKNIFNITIYDEFIIEEQHKEEVLSIINKHMLEKNIIAQVKTSNDK